ncbi:hypothetical protein DPMN_004396 [Dreissena polymorpha]|uniref:Uncharacterized protein n=1 Tax=Dreissena polymorpha TaxID=45954 RepID=A0A9D4MSL1_DREPO|nr:hypothetical protein DPMN_004396 [Dreissena polymorpha]
MWTNGRRTMTNSKTSPEQSEINKTNCSITRKIAPPPGGQFHDDWAKNVTSRVQLPPLPGSHVIQLTETIFELNSCIKETNVLTKFHKNWAKNVTTRVFTCFHYKHMPTGGHSNFHDDWAKIVTSSVFTRKTAPPTGGHVFQRTRTTFEVNQHIIKRNILTNFQLHGDIIGTNLLTKFHEDRTKNVASRVCTRKTAPPTGGHVFQQTRTTFELKQHTIKTNILTNFELDRDIIGTKLLTKFHKDWKRNVPSKVFTNKYRSQISPEQSGKLPPPPGNQVFQRIGTIFELNSHIKETNVLTKFHENWAKNVTSRRPCFSPIWTIFELVREFNKTDVLTNFHNDWAKIVTSRVFTRFLYSRIKKTAPPSGGHVFQRTRTTFELNQHIIKTNILTNDLFHEDWTIYKQMWTDGQKTYKDRSQKLI